MAVCLRCTLHDCDDPMLMYVCMFKLFSNLGNVEINYCSIIDLVDYVQGVSLFYYYQFMNLFGTTTKL